MTNLRKKLEWLYPKTRHQSDYRWQVIKEIISIPELKEIIEKAEKYDKLFENLQVVEKCKHERYFHSTMLSLTCPDCKNMSKITRPLVDEEKREVEEHCINIFFGGYDYLTLKSGTRVEARKSYQ